MGDERIKRRRFLADLLFAGGALTAAALAARVYSASPPPEPQVQGGTTCPSPVPTEAATPVRETKAKPIPENQRRSWRTRPSDQLPGDAWLPEPSQKS